ncbi:uncharacterized protein BROUX77_003044 [Berkeleyomyces rouxiae]|uniref:uncharacterized protein n=1 Tax=Berkeleyomyces rouxiae TaxID=2035830 RepID=UPI003B8006C4
MNHRLALPYYNYFFHTYNIVMSIAGLKQLNAVSKHKTIRDYVKHLRVHLPGNDVDEYTKCLMESAVLTGTHIGMLEEAMRGLPALTSLTSVLSSKVKGFMGIAHFQGPILAAAFAECKISSINLESGTSPIPTWVEFRPSAAITTAIFYIPESTRAIIRPMLLGVNEVHLSISEPFLFEDNGPSPLGFLLSGTPELRTLKLDF